MFVASAVKTKLMEKAMSSDFLPNTLGKDPYLVHGKGCELRLSAQYSRKWIHILLFFIIFTLVYPI